MPQCAVGVAVNCTARVTVPVVDTRLGGGFVECEICWRLKKRAGTSLQYVRGFSNSRATRFSGVETAGRIGERAAVVAERFG